MLKYISTRNQGEESKNFSEVVIEGLAPDGGLYVPEACPKISTAELEELKYVDYAGIAHRTITPFVDDSINSDELYQILQASYLNFSSEDTAPLKKINDDIYILELFHGPTLAFKDFALQFLGNIFDNLLAKQNKKLTIIGATSGDTGSAAIEACRDKENLEVFILHPHNRVSDVQRKQMTSVASPNIHNIAIEGSFDDCQTLVKAMFNDKELKKDKNLSAINSINWGRIIAQVAYYVFAYLRLKTKEDIDRVIFSVPTGNFGNIFAGYIAMSMGIPIEKLIIGTNSNDILFRLLATGKMEIGTVKPTISPSMDIQISSNFERILFDLLGRDGKAITKIMQHFATGKGFILEENIKQQLLRIFKAYRFDDDQTKAIIKQIYTMNNYILDPHSAIGVGAAMQYLLDNKKSNNCKIISLATASPAKFSYAIEDAIGVSPKFPPKLAEIINKEEYFTVLPNDFARVKDFIREKAK